MSDENEVTTEKRKAAGPLSETAIAKVDGWIAQIQAKKPVRLSRKAFLSWYVESAPENLSNSEILAVVERFYDPEAHALQVLRDVRRAKRDGQPLRALELVVKEKKTVERARAAENVDSVSPHVDEPTDDLTNDGQTYFKNER